MDRQSPGNPSSSDDEDHSRQLAKMDPLTTDEFGRYLTQRAHKMSEENAMYVVREPLNAPTGVVLQRVLGFAKFLKDYTSPRNKRVTAGGRIVPVGPKSPPPTFQVEHIDTVLRTAEQSQKLLNTISQQPGHSVEEDGQSLLSSTTVQNQSAIETNDGAMDDSTDMQQLGMLKIPKSFVLVEQIDPNCAMVKLGGTYFQASRKNSSESVSFQTVTLGAPKPPAVMDYMNPVTQQTEKFPDFVDDTYQPTNIATFGVTSPAYSSYQRHTVAPAGYASNDYATAYCGPTIGNQSVLNVQESVQQQRQNPYAGGLGASHHYAQDPRTFTVSQPQYPALLEGLVPTPVAVPNQAWSVEIMTILRSATEAYQNAQLALKEHEKYTALNEMHMSSQEITFAIEKKKHLINACDGFRKRKELFENMQHEQLNQFRAYEASQAGNWSAPQALPQMPSFFAYSDGQGGVQFQTRDYSAPAKMPSTTEDRTSASPGSSNTKSKKSLSPRAAEFVPHVPGEQTLKPNATADCVHPQQHGAKQNTSMIPPRSGKGKTNILENVGRGGYTADWVRKATESHDQCLFLAAEKEQTGKTSEESETPSATTKSAIRMMDEMLAVAQQASMSEKASRRSRMSARNKSQDDMSGFVNAGSEKTAMKRAIRKSEETPGELSEMPRHALRLQSNSAHKALRQSGEDPETFKKPDRHHVRFGIADALAAFENSKTSEASINAGSGHKPSSSEAISLPKDRSLLSQYPRESHTNASVSRVSGSRSSSKQIATQIEERIVREQQKLAASMSYGGGYVTSGFSPTPMVQPSLAFNGSVPFVAPNLRGSRIYPGSGAKVGASYGVNHGSDAHQFSVPASAGAAMTSLRSSLPILQPGLRGGYVRPDTSSFNGRLLYRGTHQHNGTRPMPPPAQVRGFHSGELKYNGSGQTNVSSMQRSGGTRNRDQAPAPLTVASYNEFMRGTPSMRHSRDTQDRCPPPIQRAMQPHAFTQHPVAVNVGYEREMGYPPFDSLIAARRNRPTNPWGADSWA